jgi:hypothetical protein
MIGSRERCILLRVQIVERKRKFPLNRMATGQYIVETAIKSIEDKDFKIR